MAMSHQEAALHLLDLLPVEDKFKMCVNKFNKRGAVNLTRLIRQSLFIF